MFLCFLLIIATIVLDILCIKASWDVRKIQKEENTEVKVVMQKTSNWLGTTIVSIPFLGMGVAGFVWLDDWILGVGACVLYGSVILFCLLNWLDGIIIYDEKGFSMGYLPRRIKYYLYEDVKNILAKYSRFAILIGNRTIDSANYGNELTEFKEYILMKRKENPVEESARTQNIQCYYKQKAIFLGIGSLFMMFVGIVVMGGFLWNLLSVMSSVWIDFLAEPSFAVGIWLLFQVLIHGLMFCLGLWIAALGWSFIAIEKKEYAIRLDGISVKYPFESWKNIAWEEFQQVCICYEGSMDGRQTEHIYEEAPLICFVKKGEVKNIYGRWKTHYPFHYRKVISINYTEELYEEVKEKCPYAIVDLRKNRSYNTADRSEMYKKK